MTIIVPLDVWRRRVERVRSEIFAELSDDDMRRLDGSVSPGAEALTPEALAYRLAFNAEMRARQSGECARPTVSNLDFSL